MTECGRLSDRLPDVALGRAGWTAAEQAHLDTCDDCRAEWELVRGAAHLGEGLPRAHDPEALTAAVLGRVAGERTAARTRRRTWLAAGLAAAAVAIIVVRTTRAPIGVAVPVPAEPAVTAPSVVATAPQAVALPELDDLPDAELESILGSLDGPSGASPAADDPGFDDLEEHELEGVLQAWEG